MVNRSIKVFFLGWFLAISAFANQEKARAIFDQKFQIKRDDKSQITSVVYRMGTAGFSADIILQTILAEIKSLNRQWKQYHSSLGFYAAGNKPTTHSAEVAEAVSDLYANYNANMLPSDQQEYYVNGSDTRVEQMRWAMENMQSDRALNQINSLSRSKLWSEFSNQLGKVLLRIRPDILAVPGDQSYFFQRQLITKFAEMLLKNAAKQFPGASYLALASELFAQIEAMIAEQRNYNQNYLIYLLENYKPETFGLTENERAQIVSSMYQSRMGLFELAQFKKMADADWTAFGWGIYYTQKRAANDMLHGFEKSIYDPSATQRLCSSFAIVVEKGHKKIVNLFDRAHMFSVKPSLAYDYEHPKKVKIMRLLIKLGQLGVNFIPMPGMIKSFIDNFANSTYQQQVITEGALAAYFAVSGNEGLSVFFAKQSANPFLR